MKDISPLERKGLSQVLLFLYERKGKEPPNMTEIKNAVTIHGETLIALIDFLKELDLVKDEYTATFPKKRIVYLTEPGLVVAQHLSAIANGLGPPPTPKKKKPD